MALHAGSGTRAHPEKRQSRKAAKPPWNAQAAKPQSRKAAMERSSRKAAKPPWPQALRLMRCLLRSSPLRCHRHGTLKPQSRKAAKPQSRKAASSETHAPSHVFIAAAGTRAHPGKRQSRKAAMERPSRKAAKPPSRQAATERMAHSWPWSQGMAQEEDDPQDSRDMVLHMPGWGNEAWPPAWLPAPIRPMRGSVGRFSAAAVSSCREECNNAPDFFGDLPVSDRVGHDKTGVGYKDPSPTTNWSLALPSSSSTLPVDLQKNGGSSQFVL